MYYKVDAYQSEEFGKEERICEIIVYKKNFKVYELLTNREVSIQRGKTIFGNKKTDGKILKELSDYGKSIYILSEDINDYKIASEEDIKKYIDESDDNIYIKFVQYKEEIDQQNKKY